MDLAKRFWFEGAVRGNPLAQIALGDEILFQARESGDADTLLLAAVLFGLAARQGQGNVQAMESLKRVLEFNVAFSAHETQDIFLVRPLYRLPKLHAAYHYPSNQNTNVRLCKWSYLILMGWL